jgi:DNA-binding MarR family transcriptional regulator
MKKTGTTKDIPRAVMALLMDFLMQQRKRFQTIAEEMGGPPPQAFMLIRLKDFPEGLPMSAIAEDAGCDPSNVTSWVDKLEDRGLLRREPSLQDRRVKRVVITEKGKQVAARLLEQLLEPQEWLLSLSEADQRRLRDILERGLHPQA